MSLISIYRSLPSFRGKIRLANMLFNRDARDVLVNTPSGKFLLPNLRDNQYFEIYVKGSYEPGLVNYIARQVPKNGVFLDIGANIGSVAVAVARKRPDIRVISIEALPRNYEYLTQNVKLNGLTNITTVNECCSESAGVTVRFYTHETMYGSSSLHNIHSNNYVELVTSTIDDQLRALGVDKIDLIKIDTEGSEALVFRGAQQCFSAHKPPVLFEYNDEYENAVPGLKAGDAQVFLLERGYVLYDFDHLASTTPFKEARFTGSGEFLAVHSSQVK